MDAKTLSTPLYSAKFWIKFVAVLSIIYGALMVLTIFGIVIAWLPIWLGVLLFQSAGQVEQAYLADDVEALHTALSKLRTFFTILGIMYLIMLILFALGLVLGLSSTFSAMSTM